MKYLAVGLVVVFLLASITVLAKESLPASVQEITTGTDKETTKETTKETVKKTTKGATKETTKEKTKETVKDTTKSIPQKPTPMPWSTAWLIGVAALVLVAYGIAIGSLLGASKNNKWSLAAALSEEVETKANNVVSTKPVASSSRLIAFLGLIGILGIFLGTGFYMLWSLFSKGTVVGELDKISKFLAVGGTIFVPYLANQLKDIFKK